MKKNKNLRTFEADVLEEEAGFLEASNGEIVTQHAIQESVDITSAQKHFDLSLKKFGPYYIDYARNGRYLLLGGQKGHVAAFDWQTKKLMCEMNVMQSVHDVKWLHIETMFAVAQKDWTYIYDNQGVELHCLKMLDHTLRLEFLPYHFLLVSASCKSYLTWLDVSIGKQIGGVATGLGRLDVMTHNPQNAVVALGHAGGTVTMWSPNVKEPLVKMLCHGSATRSITIDNSGNYMATSGFDRQLRIWDLRTYKLMHTTRRPLCAYSLAFSQRGLLAAAYASTIDIYEKVHEVPITTPYLSHSLKYPGIAEVSFCPFEDVLGVGHINGFTSLLVPGAGEANYDALEANLFQTKQQRRQMEVRLLLEKVNPDLINLDTSILSKVNISTLKEKLEKKAKSIYLRPQEIDFEPKFRKKGKSKAAKKEKRRQGVIDERKRQTFRKKIRQIKNTDSTDATTITSDNVLNRFKKKQL